MPCLGCVKTKYEKMLTKKERKEAIGMMLAENFPLKIIIITTLMEALLGLMAIGFQIASIVVRSPLYFVGTG